MLVANAGAETLRLATWHVELTRKGPGLLLRDVHRDDPQVEAVVAVVQSMSPDVLLLTGIDWDFEGIALQALATKIGDYPHHLAMQPNTGVPTGLDLDGDGRLAGPRDAQGFGWFRGQGGMALLSKRPLKIIADHSATLWAEQSKALLFDGITEQQSGVQRLSSVGHWEVDVAGLRLLTFSASPPVFDGPEDRNGRRNHDEIAFWTRRLEAYEKPIVVLGKANLDPLDGEGLHKAIVELLSHPRLQDTQPRSDGGEKAANPSHQSDPGLDTADWSDPSPGNLRVSYVLPDRELTVVDSGVVWPKTEHPMRGLVDAASRHRLVWVDVVLPK